MSRDELHGMSSTAGDSSSGGAASPLTARSMRLERVAQALAHSQEELRRYVHTNQARPFLLILAMKILFEFLRLEIAIGLLVCLKIAQYIQDCSLRKKIRYLGFEF